MGFDIAVPSADEAAAASDIHLRAMDANLLTQAQFPGPAAREFFRGWLTRNTFQHARDADKGVLVARDPASGRVASFVKWLVHGPGGAEVAARDLEGWSDICGTAVLRSYGELAEAARRQALGTSPYYHVTFLCTDPQWGGRGAATALLGRVQELAAADGMAIILESTMEGVPLYQKMGFRTERELNMTLPPGASTEPAQPYEERCMVWTPPHALGDFGSKRPAQA
ncbi:acetyltransferase (GNAT) domain-containing protein [Hirsutella rhossiliensis]|uniref:Acetyltransferase (GNAT) domain-containing protein n=1 Tax=Hirsutella rhossiliensis TaxID=111463 RepID=A0A9P8MPG9_9HYPO|nr:acetyltransferase (GNAT) domain-containing protein [Hirsutella rhossiliensis]KAH0958687.1 acetyltransferase (GNAT) domain-containing protein [Hirsutella rhossiliensis]